MSTVDQDRLPPRAIRETASVFLDYAARPGWTEREARMQARALSLLEWDRDLEWLAIELRTGKVASADEAAFKLLFRQRNKQAWQEFCEAGPD